MKKKHARRKNVQRRIRLLSQKKERRKITIRTKQKKEATRICNENHESKKHKIHLYDQPRYKGYKRINAPLNFSLTDNPEVVIGFIKNLKSIYKNRRKVFVNLEKVQNVTCDTLCILLSNMVLFQNNRIPFDGNFPSHKKSFDIISQSGFIEKLYSREQRVYSINNVNSLIYTHGESKSNSDIIEAMMDSCSKFLWGETYNLPGLYNIFIELMTNTFEHADEIEGNERWWATMSKDSEQEKVTFSFLDYGRGIYNTLTNKQQSKYAPIITRILNSLKINGNENALLLKQVLEGALVMSETREDNRGHGLNSIYEDYSNGLLDNLIIITNNIYINTNKGIYKTMSQSFDGTFISWEINKSTKYEDINSDSILP